MKEIAEKNKINTRLKKHLDGEFIGKTVCTTVFLRRYVP